MSNFVAHNCVIHVIPITVVGNEIDALKHSELKLSYNLLVIIWHYGLNVRFGMNETPKTVR